MIILDTNVISEAMRSQPNEAVIRWLRFTPGDELYTTAITEGEMRYGLEIAPKKKRRELEEAIRRIFSVRFAGRILPFDSHAAKQFPRILVDMRRDCRGRRREDRDPGFRRFPACRRRHRQSMDGVNDRR